MDCLCRSFHVMDCLCRSFHVMDCLCSSFTRTCVAGEAALKIAGNPVPGVYSNDGD